ncbi:MAG TPA: hypothetical protein VNN80_17505 [Polyangiaceae bacterium]|nr:hypothetical protein [Polyangiaceae bacterium]
MGSDRSLDIFINPIFDYECDNAAWVSQPPRAACLDESTITAFCGGHLSEGALASVEAHLAQCGDCLQVVGVVSSVMHGQGPPSADTREGAQVRLEDRYEIAGFIAKGGMGEVFAGVTSASAPRARGAQRWACARLGLENQGQPARARWRLARR